MIATATRKKRCEKVRYATKVEADAALDRIDAERPREIGRKLPVRSCRCFRCGGHHLTSQAKR